MKSICLSAPGDAMVFEKELDPGGMRDVHQHHRDRFITRPDRRRAVAQRRGNPCWEISLAPEPGFMRFQAVDAAVLHYTIARSPSEERPPAQTSSRGPVVNGTCRGRK